MNKVIFKYRTLPNSVFQSNFVIPMPKGAEILTIQVDKKITTQLFGRWLILTNLSKTENLNWLGQVIHSSWTIPKNISGHISTKMVNLLDIFLK